MALADTVLVPGKPLSTNDLRIALAAVIPAIRAAERERCAVVADKEQADATADMAMAGDADPFGYQQSEGAAHAAGHIAAAIRALKEPA